MWAKTNHRKLIQIWVGTVVIVFAVLSAHAFAINGIPTPSPSSDSYGLQATKTQPPPTVGATISIPSSGASYSTSPITVSGICPAGLLVQVYDNGVMVGAVTCDSGSFSIQVSLFTGTNDLTANDYDNLNQSGPTTNTVTVTYNNAAATAFGALVTLTSSYGRRATTTGTALTWPLQLAGGTGPYAFSINWGDGTPSELKSEALSGTITISHIYNKSGIYHVTIQVTDANGVSAFLQVVAVSNGSTSGASSGSSSSAGSTTAKPAASQTKVLWLPTIISVVFMIPVYWLGRRSELLALRKHLEKDVEKYKA